MGIDSGATEHITCDSRLLKEVSIPHQQSVHIPNGTDVPVKGLGKTDLPNGMHLDTFLHIPDFKCNLVSVSKLTIKHNCDVTFIASSCFIQDLHSKTLIEKGRHQGGLYLLEPIQDRTTVMKVSKIDDQLWHAQLRHASEAKITHLGLD